MEIWGKVGRLNGLYPTVRAYRSPLPSRERGIEFTTPIQHDTRHSSPFEANWILGWTPGVQSRDHGNFAAIRIDWIDNRQP